MAQVNVSLEDRVVAELDRIAEAKSLSRPELLRRVIQELIEAHDAGRVLFQKEAAPRLDTTVSFLVHELRELVVELDRAQNENARLFGKLVTDWNGGEAASQRAHESIANQIRQRNSEAYSAFYQQVEKLLAGFEALEPRLVEGKRPVRTVAYDGRFRDEGREVGMAESGWIGKWRLFQLLRVIAHVRLLANRTIQNAANRCWKRLF